MPCRTFERMIQNISVLEFVICFPGFSAIFPSTSSFMLGIVASFADERESAGWGLGPASFGDPELLARDT